jgi:hypothetical protein
MQDSEIRCRVAVVRTDNPEEIVASIIRVARFCELRTLTVTMLLTFFLTR